MIRDLSETLRAILAGAPYKELAAADVNFAHPTDAFKPTQPTVNLFLYEVRENRELRTNEPLVERRDGQAVVRRPPLRVACSYLVTAWPDGTDDLVLQEHRLLSQALLVLSAYPTIPPAFYPKDSDLLYGQEPPLPMMTAQLDDLRNPSEFWSALGNRLRPSVTVTVTISMEPAAPEAVGVVTASELRLGERASPADRSLAEAGRLDLFRIAGRVTTDGSAPAGNVTVTIPELRLSTTTDAEGRYSLGIFPAGRYTLDAAGKQVAVAVPPEAAGGYDVNLQE